MNCGTTKVLIYYGVIPKVEMFYLINQLWNLRLDCNAGIFIIHGQESWHWLFYWFYFSLAITWNKLSPPFCNYSLSTFVNQWRCLCNCYSVGSSVVSHFVISMDDFCFLLKKKKPSLFHRSVKCVFCFKQCYYHPFLIHGINILLLSSNKISHATSLASLLNFSDNSSITVWLPFHSISKMIFSAYCFGRIWLKGLNLCRKLFK